MRAKTQYGPQKPNRSQVERVGSTAVLRLRENIEAVTMPDGETGWQADEYELTYPWSSTISTRVEADSAAYLAQAKREDYDRAAAQAREKRNALLAATDKDCLVDREPTEATLAYRQALRDLPEQESWPYGIVWPEK